MLSTVVGYTGGSTPDPTYQAIGDHTEALRVEFDPTRVSYEELVLKFWREHDPMPFAMVGYQYQSAVWHHTPTQEAVIAAVKARLLSPSGRPRPPRSPHSGVAPRYGGGAEVSPAALLWRTSAATMKRRRQRRRSERHSAAASRMHLTPDTGATTL